MIHCVSFNNTNAFKFPQWLRLFPFLGGGYVVVNLLFVAASIVWQLILYLSYAAWLYYAVYDLMCFQDLSDPCFSFLNSFKLNLEEGHLACGFK